MIRVLALLYFLLIAAPMWASDKDIEGENYCKSDQANSDWAKQLKETPNDPIIVKLYALRLGLCAMIDGGLVTFDDAIVFFEEEREKMIIERTIEQKGNETIS